MGRDAGFLAQNCAIACGAEAAIVPEEVTDEDQLAEFMKRGIRKSKKSCIVLVSESPKCGAMFYSDRVRKEFPEFDVRVSILGHLQRGGSPSARDRILASRLFCRVSATSWWASATTMWCMYPSQSASALISVSTSD